MYFRLMAEIFDLLVTLTSDSIRISRSVLLGPENVAAGRWNLVGISTLSYIQSDIFVIAYVLLVLAAIFDFPDHSCIEE